MESPSAMTKIAYLSLGSNLGNREDYLKQAIASLGRIGKIRSVSSFYETEPVEFTEQALFLNCVVAIRTTIAPAELIGRLLEVERSLGRERIQMKGPRTIDIDILLYGDTVMNSPELTIPHPAMPRRRFVLAPMAEIAPDACHPVLKKTVRQLLEELPPGQNVWKFCKT